GFEDRVVKYGLEFPALQFLVGPGRETPLALAILAVRWMFVHSALVVILALGMRIADQVLNFWHPDAAICNRRSQGVVAASVHRNRAQP
ncbi:MAG: hypothetical protein RKL32_03880, partial [Gammaproteobacteria bacterium]